MEGLKKEDTPLKNHGSLLGTQAQGYLWGSDGLEPTDGQLPMSWRAQWLLFTDGGAEAQEGRPAHAKYAGAMQPALNRTPTPRSPASCCAWAKGL